jgi:hypothetical protein
VSFDPELDEFFHHTVVHKPFSGRTAFGVASFGTGTTYAAKIERRQKLVKGGDGREVLSTTTVYIRPTSTGGLPNAGPQDFLGLNGSTTPTPILALKGLTDEEGDHHEVLYCG